MNDKLWGQIYEDHGIGGVIAEAYNPDGFSKFALVLLTFSVLGNNVSISSICSLRSHRRNS